MREAIVTTGSRLHFGLLALDPQLRRRCGGIGVMLHEPRCRIRVRSADTDGVQGGDAEVSRRVREFLERYREHDETIGPVNVSIEASIPGHAGLGSGTQTGLAVAAALSRLSGHEVPDPVRLAQIVGRGRRSAVGIHGFRDGGFLVDAGRAPGGDVGDLATQVPFPADWRFALITPVDQQGLCGSSERQAFEAMPSMPATLTGELSHTILTEVLPALRHQDFPGFCDGLDQYGTAVGRFFEPVQGGVFSSPLARRITQSLRDTDQRSGIAQSSWGPTICVVCRDGDDALAVTAAARRIAGGEAIRTCITSARNTGASVELIEEC